MKKNENSIRIIPLLTVLIIVFTMVCIPVKILGWKYLPHDDALRHAAKAVSGKDWSRILVLRSDIKMDSHAGWHAFLRIVHKVLDFDAYHLVLFSVFFLFLLFALIPVFLLERPEAWVVALITVNLADPSKTGRLLMGRPYLVTMAVIIVIGCLWRRLAEKKIRYGIMAILAALIAIATWIHGGWYFFILPVAAFFIARQWRAGFRLTMAVIAGVIIGAIFTGHPIMFLTQMVRHALLAFSNYRSPGVLVLEFRPFMGDNIIVMTVILMLMWRALRGRWRRDTIDNPVFILAVMSWILGFITTRVWLDIGLAAVLLWIAEEFQGFLIDQMPFISWKRALTTCLVCGVLFLSMTNDANSRWSSGKPVYSVKFDTPEKAAWAPGPGGIVYNSDMGTFYSMFYRNPTAPWRYMLGFEPGIMPREDVEIYRKIQADPSPASFELWVRKMRPEDRMIVFNLTGESPKIEGLEWYDGGNCLWIGRIPQKNAKNLK